MIMHYSVNKIPSASSGPADTPAASSAPRRAPSALRARLRDGERAARPDACASVGSEVTFVGARRRRRSTRARSCSARCRMARRCRGSSAHARRARASSICRATCARATAAASVPSMECPSWAPDARRAIRGAERRRESGLLSDVDPARARAAAARRPRRAPARPIIANSASGVTGAGNSPKRELSVRRGGRGLPRLRRREHAPPPARRCARRSARSAPTRTSCSRRTCCRSRAASSRRSPCRSPQPLADPLALYRDAYASEPFIEVADAAADAARRGAAQRRAHRRRRCSPGTRTPTLLVTSAIDNLVKGAAGQAVQNANLMLGLDETRGAARVTRVIKVGGRPQLDPALPRGRSRPRSARAPGSLVVVHGGGDEVSTLQRLYGVEARVRRRPPRHERARTSRSSAWRSPARRTSGSSSALVRRRVCRRSGFRARTGRCSRADPLDPARYGHVGAPAAVNVALLRHLLDARLSAGDLAGESLDAIGRSAATLNVNGDDAAAAIAAALGADELLLVSDVAGVLAGRRGRSSTLDAGRGAAADRRRHGARAEWRAKLQAALVGAGRRRGSAYGSPTSPRSTDPRSRHGTDTSGERVRMTAPTMKPPTADDFAPAPTRSRPAPASRRRSRARSSARTSARRWSSCAASGVHLYRRRGQRVPRLRERHRRERARLRRRGAQGRRCTPPPTGWCTRRTCTARRRASGSPRRSSRGRSPTRCSSATRARRRTKARSSSRGAGRARRARRSTRSSRCAARSTAACSARSRRPTGRPTGCRSARSRRGVSIFERDLDGARRRARARTRRPR